MSGTLILALAALFLTLLFFLPLAVGPGRSPGGRLDSQKNKKRQNKRNSTIAAATGPPDRGQAAPGAAAAGTGPDGSEPPPAFKVAQMRYEGGDWAANPGALEELCRFYRDECEHRDYSVVFGPRGRELPRLRPDFVYATGHHGFSMLPVDLRGLMDYLEGGGFVLIEDNNGLDQALRWFLGEAWPNHRLEVMEAGELFSAPFALPVYPKVRLHQGRPARLFRIRVNERPLDFFYSFSADLGDGWQNHSHLRVPADLRRRAFEMGSNLIACSLRAKNLDAL